MKHYKLKALAKQAGLTLLELTVVMTILIALGGLMVPYVSSFFGTTQDSTSVSSLAEVDKWMQGYYTKSRKEPNNMEALINGGTAAGTVASTLTTVPPGCNTSTPAPNAYSPALNAVYCNMIFPGYFNPILLTSALTTSTSGVTSSTTGTMLLTSLNLAGITSLYYNNPNTADATFASTLISSSTLAQPATLSTGSYVAQVIMPSIWPQSATGTIEDYLADVFGTSPSKFDGQQCYSYIAFGIGNQSSLTGAVMATAPVHFNADGTSGPVLKYNRYVVIYQVDANNNASALQGIATGLNPAVWTKGCPAGIESAKYIGTVIAGNQTDGHLMGLARTQGTAYENINNNNGN